MVQPCTQSLFSLNSGWAPSHPEILDLLNCACLAENHASQLSHWCFTSVHCFKTNQNLACNGTLESCSFCQAWAVGIKDYRNEKRNKRVTRVAA